jgi:hypothetical protein
MLLFSESTFLLYATRRLCAEIKTMNFKSLSFVRTMWYSVWTLICQASSVRTTRIFRPDSNLCSEASSYSKLHSSECFSNTFGRPSVFQCLTSKMISFQNTNMGRQLQTVRMSTLHLLDTVIDKASCAEDVQLSGRQSALSGRSTLLCKFCGAEVQPSRR